MFASATRPTATPGQHPPQTRLLILDDERFDRHRLQRLCSGLPDAVQVETADCLAKLADALEGSRFDLIFVDYNLPDGSGIHALDMIRMCPRNGTAATVMITGLDRQPLEETAHARGCAAFLSKDDINAEVFAQTVAKALHQTTPLDRGATQYDRATVEALIAAAGTRFARDMKPLVSRMLRQTRMHRMHPDQTAPQPALSPFEVTGDSTLESSCVALWDYLVSLEHHAAMALPDVTPLAPDHRATAAQTPDTQEQKRKPPSPFTRMN